MARLNGRVYNTFGLFRINRYRERRNPWDARPIMLR